jgi:hypothetical protein
VLLVLNALWNKLTTKTSPKFISIIFTYALTSLAWIFFRANSISDALTVVGKICSEPGPLFKGDGIPALMLPLMMILILLFKEIKDECSIKLNLMHHSSLWISIPSCAFIVIIILLCAEFNSGQFIYFQF